MGSNIRRAIVATVLAVSLIGFGAPSYSQCAGCGADYNRTEREQVMPAYRAGQKQGYEQGRQDGANEERLKNALSKLTDNADQIGSDAARGK